MSDADQAGPSSEQHAAGVAAPASTARPRRHASNKEGTTDQSGRSSEPDDAAASEPIPAAESAPAGDAELEAEDVEAAGAAGKSLEELAVRFSQATKELQVRV